MSILYDPVPHDDPILPSLPPPIYTFPSHNTAVRPAPPTGAGAPSCHLMFTGPLNKSGVGDWTSCSYKLVITMVTCYLYPQLIHVFLAYHRN